MAKRVQKEHAERKNELLDVAQGLLVRNGYDATPVSAILTAAGIAKGTFYHYFASKEDLLDALVERMIEQIIGGMRSAVADQELNAVEKLVAYFRASSHWKAQNREALMAIVRPIYSDENLLLRTKMNRRTLELGREDLTAIIEQGVAEGAFDTESPVEAAEMIYGIAFSLRETNAELFLGMDEHPEYWDLLQKKIDFYQDAVERLLGAKKGSLDWVDEKAMDVFRPRGRRKRRKGGGRKR